MPTDRTPLSLRRRPRDAAFRSLAIRCFPRPGDGGRHAGPSAAAARKPQPFAPGVETIIPVDLQPEETVSIHDIVELHAEQNLAWTPAYLSEGETLHNMARDVRFRRDVWCLEFAFKPLRMMWVDIPTASGKTNRSLVWYMVYRVKNTGETLRSVDQGDGSSKSEPGKPQTMRYVPHFVLQTHDPAGSASSKAYLDRVIPAAIEPIRRREVPGRALLDSVSLSEQPLKVGEEKWGVVTWTGLDPGIDFFSIFVRGLSNAYQWTDPEGAFQAGDPPGTGRQFVRKTLQLNFWRPGDEFLAHEGEIRYGAAPGKGELYGSGEGVSNQWVYR